MSRTKWQQYLKRQAMQHPAMKPQDVYKMIFQAVFGAEHLLQDKEAAHGYFQREFEAVCPIKEPLYEQIDVNRYRVNLGAWKMRNLPSEWLFRLFVCSVEKAERSEDERQQTFWQYVREAEAMICSGVFSFSGKEFEAYTAEYKKEGLRAVHHSEEYRQAENPSYRLVSGEYIRILPILERISAIANMRRADGKNAPIVVAIDGRCGSGKSTMASMLSDIIGAGVVHVDDFFLPIELRTEDRLAQPGGNVHYERFAEEILPNLKGNIDFTYQRFVCRSMQLGEQRKVSGASVYVVEGAYSHHPYLGEYADVKVFSHVEEKEQLRRIEERDGGRMLTSFKERWIPMEESYFAEYRVRECADIVV